MSNCGSPVRRHAMAQGVSEQKRLSPGLRINACQPCVTGLVYRRPSSPSARFEDGWLSIACLLADVTGRLLRADRMTFHRWLGAGRSEITDRTRP
jgi:hypothetical protein